MRNLANTFLLVAVTTFGCGMSDESDNPLSPNDAPLDTSGGTTAGENAATKPMKASADALLGCWMLDKEAVHEMLRQMEQAGDPNARVLAPRLEGMFNSLALQFTDGKVTMDNGLGRPNTVPYEVTDVQDNTLEIRLDRIGRDGTPEPVSGKAEFKNGLLYLQMPDAPTPWPLHRLEGDQLQKRLAIIEQAKSGPGPEAPAEQRIMWLVNSTPEEMKSLLDHQPDLATLREERDETALHFAARFGKVDIARTLIGHDADPKALNAAGQSPLHHAVTSLGEENTELVQMLLDAGVDPNQKDQADETPLSRSMKHERNKIVRLLLGHGAAMEVENASDAFRAAVRRDQLAVVESLLKSHVKVDEPLDDGRTPLHVAVGHGKIEIAKYLVEQKADVNAVSQDDSGRSVLQGAVGIGGKPDIVALLLERGADPNFVDKHGASVLHTAAGSGSAEVVGALVGAGADIEACAGGGLTPLMEAVRMGNIEAAKSLLEAGADQYAKNDSGWEAGQFAQTSGNAEMMELFGVEPLPIPPRDPDAPVTIPLLGTVKDVKGLGWTSYRGVPQGQVFHQMKCRLTVNLPGDAMLVIPLLGSLSLEQTDTVISSVRMSPLEKAVPLPQVVAAMEKRLEENSIELDEESKVIVAGWKTLDAADAALEKTEFVIRLNTQFRLEVGLRSQSPDEWHYELALEASPHALVGRIREAASSWCLTPTFSLEHENSEVYRVAFSPDSKYLATATYRYVHLWDIETKKRVDKFGSDLVGEGNVLLVQFAPDGNRLGAVYGDRVARVWDLRLRRLAKKISADNVRFGPFSPDLTSIIAITDAGGVEVWDVKQSARTVSLAWGKNQVGLARFLPRGDGILLAPRQGNELQLWNATTGKRLLIYEPEGYRGTLNDAVASPDSSTIFTASGSWVQAYETATGKRLLQIRSQASHSIAVAPNENGRFVAASSWLANEVESIRIFDTTTRQQVAEFGKFEQPVYSVTFSPDGKWLAAGLKDNNVLVWDVSEITGT
ncbi:MAG: ankyrin repeat domain-containing protein [Planctomycetes bacterium]|nr:ankyrin repeat domain-containing protein [Planctomycetota bacterium]